MIVVRRHPDELARVVTDAAGDRFVVLPAAAHDDDDELAPWCPAVVALSGDDLAELVRASIQLGADQ